MTIVRRDAAGWSTVNRKILKPKSGIKPRVYLGRSTMHEKFHFVSRNWRKENRTVACGSSPIKIHYCDYQKRFINRINEVYDFSFVCFTCFRCWCGIQEQSRKV